MYLLNFANYSHWRLWLVEIWKIWMTKRPGGPKLWKFWRLPKCADEKRMWASGALCTSDVLAAPFPFPLNDVHPNFVQLSVSWNRCLADISHLTLWPLVLVKSLCPNLFLDPDKKRSFIISQVTLMSGCGIVAIKGIDQCGAGFLVRFIKKNFSKLVEFSVEVIGRY